VLDFYGLALIDSGVHAMAMHAKLTQPPTDKGSMTVEPAITVVLEVEDPVQGGSWLRLEQDGRPATLPEVVTAIDNTLTLTMDRAGTCAGDVACFFDQPSVVQHVFYRGGDSHIHELVWTRPSS
jgi:hypothetical protein